MIHMLPHLLFVALWVVAGYAFGQVPRAAEQYRLAVIASAASTFGPSAPVALLAGQIHVESLWRAGVTSGAGAQGLCQFMPATAAGMARAYPDLRPPLPFDPSWCIRARDRLMLENLRRYRVDRSECSQWLFALASYNGSPAALDREVRQCREDSICDPARWFGHVETKVGRAGWAWAENRAYGPRILVSQALYASWGPRACVPQ